MSRQRRPVLGSEVIPINMTLPKVFCVGFHKTGTTSLSLALRSIGYRVAGAMGVGDPEIATNALSMALALVKDYDAFRDNPWPILYKEIDRAWPGSRFIITVRPVDQWMRSVMQHFRGTSTPMRVWIYGHGDPEHHEAEYMSRYIAHNVEVVKYFRHRPGDHLVMNITEGDGWEKLGPFLGLSPRLTSFPCANRAPRSMAGLGA